MFPWTPFGDVTFFDVLMLLKKQMTVRWLTVFILKDISKNFKDIFTILKISLRYLDIFSRYLTYSKKYLKIFWIFKNIFIIFTNPSARAGYDTRSIFKRSFTGLSSEFSFFETSCLTKAEEPSLPYYLPVAGGRIIGFIPFPWVLVQCEMKSVSSRIWTRIVVSNSYDDNHYITGTSKISLWNSKEF